MTSCMLCYIEGFTLLYPMLLFASISALVFGVLLGMLLVCLYDHFKLRVEIDKLKFASCIGKVQT